MTILANKLNGEISGQEVAHAHLHLLPRFVGDGHQVGFSGVDAKKSDREKLDQKATLIRHLIK